MIGKAKLGRLRLLIVQGAHDPIADWQAMLLDRLTSDPKIELVGVLDGQKARILPSASLLLRAILIVERWIVGRQILPYEKIGARSVLARLPRIHNTPEAPKVDLALVLGTRNLAVEQLELARHGEWSVSFCGAQQATHVATSAKQRAAPGMSVQILRRTVNATEPTVVRTAQYNQKPGAVLTGAFVEEKSVLLVLRALHDLVEMRAQSVMMPPPLNAPKLPRFFEVFGYAAYFGKALAKKLREKWCARRGRLKAFWQLATGTGDFLNFEPRFAVKLPSRSHTMADPFLFEKDGKKWVFYEALNADGSDGWIEVAELDGDTLKSSSTALKCPYHLSFPFVFQDGDDIFMLPETNQSRRLEVWRATNFPTAWELHAKAFEGQYLAESTLWRSKAGQWWLLTNLSDHHAFQDHSSELYLFTLDGPGLGSIIPHPGNPVAIGADHARNAGALIHQNGRLFRPSQNNSYGVYGYGLNLMEITQLDAITFEETIVRRWTPHDRPGINGIHHLSAAGDRYVFDWSGT
jgi:hypothetical protein